MVLWCPFAQLAQIFCLPNSTLTCKEKLNGYTAVEHHKFMHFNCLLFKKWHNVMKCLDSGHDSSLLCGSVLKTLHRISETHFCYLSFPKAGNYCFRTAVLSGANLLMFVGAQGTDNCTSTTYTLHKIADYLPISEKIHFTFLLSLSHFSLYDTFCICMSFQCGYFAICLAEVSQNEKHLSPHGRQVPALTGCSATGTAVRQCSSLLWLSVQETSCLKVSLFSCPLQACRDWGDFLSDAETSLPRHCMMRVVHLSLPHKEKVHADLKQI